MGLSVHIHKIVKNVLIVIYILLLTSAMAYYMVPITAVEGYDLTNIHYVATLVQDLISNSCYVLKPQHAKSGQNNNSKHLAV